tara:strand:+ start:3230 stop:4144 length:915 start_codon:yes stop_codon:yes gene_type:complete
MSLFLHIGYPKTSTTYLQNYYFNRLNVNFLGKKLHSESWINSSERRRYNHLIKILNERNKNHTLKIPKETTLISAESLIGNIWKDDFNNFKSINKILKHKNLKFIITIRRQSEIFYSLYKQYLWEGGKKELSAFFKNSMSSKNREFNIDCLNYNNLLMKLEKNINKNNYIILPCEMISEKYFNEFNKIFSNFLNLKLKKINYKNEIIRTGYSTNEQFYVRISNKFQNCKLNNHKDVIIRKPNLFQRLKNPRNYFLKIAKLESFFFKRELKNLEDIKIKVNKYFYKSNKELSKKLPVDLSKFNYY